jgi:NADPH2:quinone reductase
MRGIVCEYWCEPEELVLLDLPEPRAGPDEVVIENRAVGLNFFDILKVRGKHQTKPALPFSPGSEFSGVVSEVGPGVEGLAVGDRVLARTGVGAAREKTVAPAGKVLKIAESLSHERAAGLSSTYSCALHGLVDRGNARAGETLVVLGAAGGTGLAAIEVGKVLGLRVIACASSAEKLRFCAEHGADELVNYREEDLKQRLKELGGSKGIDLVYDPVGGDVSEPALRSLGFGGRFLVIGFASGPIPSIPLNLPLVKSCDIRGVFQGQFDAMFPEHSRANMEQIVTWAEQGRLSAHAHAVFPLEQIAQALAVLSDGKAMGKVVLKM